MPHTRNSNRNLVCFSPIDWDEVWEGPQEIMARFAGSGWNVLFVENVAGRVPRFRMHDAVRSLTRVKKLLFRPAPRVGTPENLTVHTPGNLPPYSWLRGINQRLLLHGLQAKLRDLGWERPMVWSYVPSALVLETTKALSPRLLVYCCIHDYAQISPQHAYLAEEEKKVLREADLVFVLSRQLLEEKRRINPEARLLPQGANLRDYLVPAEDVTTHELQHVRGPVIGYIGTIHEWVDQELLQFAARLHPEWNFVLIGPEKVRTQTLRLLPNVHLLGPKPHRKLPAYVRQFNVGIIPYMTGGFAQTIRPNKVLEYLVMGKPVVTTDLPELAEFSPHIACARSRLQFVDAIEAAISSDSEEQRVFRRELAASHSIEHKFRELLSAVEEKLAGQLEGTMHAGEVLSACFPVTGNQTVASAPSNPA